jgi:polynucleotide 5'-hydroxyl-kinase GRC3/NOL9
MPCSCAADSSCKEIAFNKGSHTEELRLQMKILDQWEQIDLERLKGTLLVIGAPDVGKTTFARYIHGRLQASSRYVAYLDGDPGQSSLGPPTTMTLAFKTGEEHVFVQQDTVWRTFVGSVSPVGHMLPVVVGAAKLAQAAYRSGAQAMIYDTTGFIDPVRGGAYLKLAKINLLSPSVVFAIQRNKELEHLLRPLRRAQRVDVVEINPSPAVRPRDSSVRRSHRAETFARYFANANPIKVKWSSLAVFPGPYFTINRLVALDDVEGFTRGLGIVRRIIRDVSEVVLQTPLPSMRDIDAIQLGNVEVDPQTYRDQRAAGIH